MKLSDVRDAYEGLSSKASDIIRQLSLAGIALVWLFKSGGASAPILDKPLLRAALFIFVALLIDLVQYLSGATIWFLYFRAKEKKGLTLDAETKAPEWLNWPAWTFFYLKAAAMLIAYCGYIIPFLVSKFWK
jgi:hypothetical protein